MQTTTGGARLHHRLRPAISPRDRFRARAIHRGRRAKIREADGIHLANAGVHIACEVILRAMRRNGLPV